MAPTQIRFFFFWVHSNAEKRIHNCLILRVALKIANCLLSAQRKLLRKIQSHRRREFAVHQFTFCAVTKYVFSFSLAYFLSPAILLLCVRAMSKFLFDIFSFFRSSVFFVLFSALQKYCRDSIFAVVHLWCIVLLVQFNRPLEISRPNEKRTK